MEKAELIAETLAFWPRLAEIAGLPSEAPPAVPILVRSDDKGARIVLALVADGRPLILKREKAAPASPDDHFARSLAAQEKARLRLGGNTHGLRVPKLLAYLPEPGIALMERLAGTTADHLLEIAQNRRDRREVLAACGRWLGEFHRASPAGAARPYQPRFILDHIRKQSALVASGRMKLAEPALYLRLAACVETAAGAASGHPSRHAQRHGDFSLRNILIDGPRVGVIDFKPEQNAPVGHDVARLLIDYAALYGEHAKIPDGQFLQGPDRTAFFRGYGLSVADEPVIGFLIRAQLLSDWARIPAAGDRRGLMHSLRLQGLIETAQRLFPELRLA